MGAGQAQARRADYDEIIANPLFKRGYGEFFDGRESAVDRRWDEAECEAYQRGRCFGLYVRREEGERVPLVRGYLAHPRAKLLLMLAMRGGDVL